MSTENDVNEVKIQYLQKSLDKAVSDMESLKESVKNSELTTVKAITALQVKLTVYSTIMAFVVSFGIKVFL